MSEEADGRVIVANVSKHQSFETALAAQRAGLLHRFVTSVYFDRHRYPYRLVGMLPRGPRRRAVRWLRVRGEPGLDPTRVRSVYCPEALTTALARVPGVARAVGAENLMHLKNELFDRAVARAHLEACDVFHGFDGCALASLARAQVLGAATVLDCPAPYATAVDGLLEEECGRHGLRPPRAARMVARARVRQSAEIARADYVLVPSEFARRTYLAAGVAPERMCVVPYGVSLRRFRPALPAAAVPMKRFRVLFVGNGFLRKGLVYLLEAVRRLGLREIELVVVGLPLAAGGRMLERYRGLFEHIAYVSPERLPELYRSADVFALPSLAEGSALVVYQALACGLPVITTEHAGSIVRDGRDGFVVPIRDSASLAERLRALHADVRLRREMGASAARRAEGFGWERYHRTLGTLYHRIIGARRGERAAGGATAQGVA